jgi:tetratricopeptide (TPR) repeat protein
MFQKIFFTVLILYVSGCSVPESNDTAIRRNGRKSTDSVVVSNLIKKSNDIYYNNIEAEPEIYDELLKEAVEIAGKNNDEIQLAKIYDVLGRRYRNKSYYKEAIDYFKKAIDIALRLDRQELLTEYYNQLAVVYRRMDQNPVALDYHFEALKLAGELTDSFNIESALNGIGNINLSLKRYHAAIEYFKRSLDISVSQNNLLGQAMNYNNIGEAFLGMNEPDSALHYFFISLDKNREMKDGHFGESICYNSIGNAYIVKGHIDLALDYLKKALVINEREGDRLNLSVSYVTLGETYMKAGDYAQAEQYLRKGLGLAKDIGSVFQMKEGYRFLSELYELKRDYRKALKLKKLSDVYKDSLINEKTIHYISTLETILESERQNKKILMLSQERETQKIKIRQQRTMIITAILLTLILAFSIILVIFQNKLRTRYKTLKYQQQLLRTQMNPHFIFNALSAIQVFIMENDKEKAVHFLSDFAKLMRQVLRSSSFDYITLRDEIAVIGYYLKLQQLRFSEPFKYEIDLDPQLDLDKVMVPPMLMQPFLENSIEHGFRNTQEGCMLILRFKKSGDALVIEIDDNGEGIDKAMEFRNKKHKSMAISITKERLEILEKDARKRTEFMIVDKKRLDPFDKGTLVRFVLPLIYKENDNQ